MIKLVAQAIAAIFKIQYKPKKLNCWNSSPKILLKQLQTIQDSQEFFETASEFPFFLWFLIQYWNPGESLLNYRQKNITLDGALN